MVREVEKLIGYQFKNRDLLDTALTHFSKLDKKKSDLSELLEHVGDSVLNLVVSHVLYETVKNPTEEKLTKMRSRMVNNKNLAKTCEAMGLSKYIKISRQQVLNKKILSKVFESIIGAIYLDGDKEGFINTFAVIEKIASSHWTELPGEEDYKSKLQQVVQKKFKEVPEYKILSQNGSHHEPFFEVEVLIGGKKIAKGQGFTKKDAEQVAAYQALKECEHE